MEKRTDIMKKYDVIYMVVVPFVNLHNTSSETE